MAEMLAMREQLPADRHGWRKCWQCRSNCQRTAMDGGNVGNAGAIASGLSSRFAEVSFVRSRKSWRVAVLALAVTTAWWRPALSDVQAAPLPAAAADHHLHIQGPELTAVLKQI